MTREIEQALAELLDRVVGIEEHLGCGRRQASTRSNAAVDDQRFNYADPAHRLKAEAIFDDLEINDRRRSWLYNNALDGIRLGQLRAEIVRQDEIYKRRYPPRTGGRARA